MRVDGSHRQELLSALSKIKPTLHIDSLNLQIKNALPDAEKVHSGQVLSTIFSINGMREREKHSSHEIALALSSAIRNNKEINQPEGEWDADEFAAFVERILDVNKDLGVIAKANDVLTNHEHVYCTARMLTDIRPVFSSDAEQKPESFVLVHTLKITYHDDEEHKEFFVALDTADVRNLLEVIQRANTKTKTLETFFKESLLNYLEVEPQD